MWLSTPAKTADLTVVTPALPERFKMLAQNMASVQAQTLQPRRHVVSFDYERAGIVKTMNAAVEGVDTEWIVPLADDDLLMKDYVEKMMGSTAGADIIYSRPVPVGADWMPYRFDFDRDDLRRLNYIPATALIRTSLWRKLGGYSADAFPEDWDFWLRSLDAGARFRHVPLHNWVYRFHEGNEFNRQSGKGSEQTDRPDSGEDSGSAAPQEGAGNGSAGEHWSKAFRPTTLR